MKLEVKLEEVTPQVTVASVETQDTSAFTRLLQVISPPPPLEKKVKIQSEK